MNKVESNTRTRLLRDNGLKQNGGEWTMVEREEISDLKASVDVDIYRDTALRYLGEESNFFFLPSSDHVILTFLKVRISCGSISSLV